MTIKIFWAIEVFSGPAGCFDCGYSPRVGHYPERPGSLSLLGENPFFFGITIGFADLCQ
ncbi:hypothetical protein [Methylocaldum sp.]|uniref:hypothetical protein n=1 Tax=Methylocaldum sp. TaxID=1969727 RepID=UPI002D248F01|nr:hypothetical protein [Methylocaldum sp.]HYE35114.1 hypothetical protein [Methylocaldum sp.]